MSLYGSLFSGVSGLTSNGTAIGVISDNISNINTTGFKGGAASFSSLVTGNLAGGGAIAQARSEINQQGLIQPTGITTDLAISGQGFFVVADSSSDQTFYTRAGSFREDNTGNLVNAAGFVLQGWPLDNSGRLPGEPGNENTTSNQLIESLVDVNIRQIGGLAFASTSISLGLNLNADEEILTGAGDISDFPATSINDGIGSTTIIVPTGNTAQDLQAGDVLTVSPGLSAAFSYTYGGFAQSNDITTTILGASTTTQVFNDPGNLIEGDAFTIQVDGGDLVQFTYKQFGPNADLRTFNSMQSLADAINTVSTMSARVENNRLYVSATDATLQVDFATVAGFTANWPAQLGLVNIVAAPNRFNTFSGLKALIDDSDGISASIQSPASDSIINITVDNPLDVVTFTDSTGGAPPGLLTEFGLDTAALGPIYDALGVLGDNMASGIISANFTRNIRVFDSLGSGHDLRVSFVKAGNNKWLAEVYAANEDEIVTGSPNGLIASGEVLFNGDGTLRNISSELANPISIVWTNNAQSSAITVDWGTAGLPGLGDTDGVTQFAGPYNVQFTEQNGAPSGQLSSVQINKEGFVIANFTNGESRQVYRLPLASFPNANGLEASSGNVYSQSDASGEFSLNRVGDAAVGSVVSEALENSNVELADELTNIIIAQRAYQANTKVISTVDDLLDELNRL
jgi:flagellar hook protein FlgE